MEELWKPIQLFENYYLISSTGRVRTLHTYYKSKKRDFLIPYLGKNGYYTVGLVSPTINKRIKIHRLVAQAFISNPENKATVNHRDGNKLNNNVENLEWMTQLENTQHAWNIGLCKHRMCGRRRMIVDTELGIFYDRVKEAWNASDKKYSYSKFSKITILNSIKHNDTRYISI